MFEQAFGCQILGMKQTRLARVFPGFLLEPLGAGLARQQRLAIVSQKLVCFILRRGHEIFVGIIWNLFVSPRLSDLFPNLGMILTRKYFASHFDSGR